MQPADIFVPFVGMMVLTLVVWLYMYARRMPFLARSGLLKKQMTALELTQASPPDVVSSSDNLKNLFELPVIFYALVLYLYATNGVDSAYLVAAWIFFLCRILHSAVHCTFNLIPLRFFFYLMASLALWFMVLRVAWRLFP
jgi:hypothetical protein